MLIERCVPSRDTAMLDAAGGRLPPPHGQRRNYHAVATRQRTPRPRIPGLAPPPINR